MNRCECERFVFLYAKLCQIEENMCLLASQQDDANRELRIIRQSLNTEFPFVAKAEYPTLVDGDKIIYQLQDSTTSYSVTFRDWVLGPLNIYFAGKIDGAFPVYINDNLNVPIPVLGPGSNDPLIGVPDNLVNKLLPATFDGSSIILT